MATGGKYGAGIGGGTGSTGSGGIVTINGGTVTAIGGEGGAGIGGGKNGVGATVTINGGTVTATAGEDAEAIGKGNSGGSSGDLIFGEGVNFAIKAGENEAGATDTDATTFSGSHSAAYVHIEVDNSVKFMRWDSVNKKLVEDKTTEYTEVTSSTTTLDAGKFYVVKGADVKTGTLTVNGTAAEPTTLILADGAKLTAQGGQDKAGINVASDKALIITTPKDGTGVLEATGGSRGAGIGGDYSGTSGAVTINGGTIIANGGNNSAGIGGGQRGAGAIVTINGGSVTAKGESYGAGIGGGEYGAGGTVTINGGTVIATGGMCGAGIGGGSEGDGGNVTINGGSVTVTAGKNAEAIGKGNSGTDSGTVTFGEGVSFTIKAGADKDNTSSKTASEYATSHSAAYVEIKQTTVADIASEVSGWDDGTATEIDMSYTGGNLVITNNEVSPTQTISLPGTTVLTASGDNWTCTENGVTYTFAMSAGRLMSVTVVSVPANEAVDVKYALYE